MSDTKEHFVPLAGGTVGGKVHTVRSGHKFWIARDLAIALLRDRGVTGQIENVAISLDDSSHGVVFDVTYENWKES